jgi:hypothetical protein
VARWAAAGAQQRQPLAGDLGVVEQRQRQQRADATRQAGDLPPLAAGGARVEDRAAVDAFEPGGQVHRSASARAPGRVAQRHLADHRRHRAMGEVGARHRHPAGQLADRLEDQPVRRRHPARQQIELSARAAFVQRVDAIDEEKSHGGAALCV